MSSSEDNVGLAFGLNVMAGSCTGIGAAIVVVKQDLRPEIIGGVLALSAGVMIYVSFVDIYMGKTLGSFEAYFKERGSTDPDVRAFQFSMLTFFGGILLTMALDFCVHKLHARYGFRAKAVGGGGGGGEPHCPCDASAALHDVGKVVITTHPTRNPREGEDSELEMEHTSQEFLNPPASPPPAEKASLADEAAPGVDRASLTRSGCITALALALHNFPEGLATFLAALADAKLGVALAAAIAIHNVPEGMAVSLPIYQATGSRWKAVGLGTASGLTEPLGGLVGYLVVMNTGMSELTYAILFGIVAGMMVYISIEELIPLALRYDQSNKYATKMLYVGMFIMALSLLLFTL